MLKTRYSFLPHTTDAYIEALGPTLEEAMKAAGLALVDTMCTVTTITPKIADHLEAKGDDELQLLLDWLEVILLKFELDGKVYSDFKIAPIQRNGMSLHVAAEALGERYNRRKHNAKVEVKAVTYHKMEIIRDDGSVILRFILDL